MIFCAGFRIFRGLELCKLWLIVAVAHVASTNRRMEIKRNNEARWSRGEFHGFIDENKRLRCRPRYVFHVKVGYPTEMNKIVLVTHCRVKTMASGVQTRLSPVCVRWGMHVNKHPSLLHAYDYRNKSVLCAFIQLQCASICISVVHRWLGRRNYARLLFVTSRTVSLLFVEKGTRKKGLTVGDTTHVREESKFRPEFSSEVRWRFKHV